MADIDDKKALEYYLRYIVSQHNKKISGRCGIGEHSAVFNKLVERFCVGSTNNSSLLEKIYYHLGKETFGKDLRPYAFFDIDTLIAYNSYLGKVRHYSKDGVSVSRAIDLAMKDMLSSRTPIEENGFYNVRKPVVLRMDSESSQLKPLKRLPTKVFESRYNVTDCQRLLDDYLREVSLEMEENPSEEDETSTFQEENLEISKPQDDEVFQEVNGEEQSETSQPKEKVDILGNGFFVFRDRRYKQIGKTRFIGIGNARLPIYKIVGMSLADDHEISLTIDVNNAVYEGQIFILGTQECMDFINSKDSGGKDANN